MNIQKILFLAVLAIIGTSEVHSMHLGASTATAIPSANVGKSVKNAIPKKLRMPQWLAQRCYRGKCTIEDIVRHLNEGGSIEDQSEHGRTLLYWVAAHGQYKLVKFLLLLGANKEARDNREETPLLIGVTNLVQCKRSNVPAVRLLVEAGANLHAIDADGATVKSIIRDSIKMADLLKERNAYHADLQYYYHAAKDCIAIRRCIENYSARAKRKRKKTKQKINQALSSSAGLEADPIQEVVCNFICGATDKQDKEFEALRAEIAKSKNIHSAEKEIHLILKANPAVLARKDETGYTPMELARFINAPQAIKTINNFGLLQEKQAQEQMQKALDARKDTLFFRIKANKLLPSDPLIDKDTMNARYYNNMTPLMVAAHDGRSEAASMLLGKGANPALTDVEGKTALWHATHKGHTEIVLLLLSKTNPRTIYTDFQLKDAYDAAAAQRQTNENHKKIMGLLLPYTQTQTATQTAAANSK